jgi:hypothetical protein
MIDGEKRLVEATLEAKRAEGEGKPVVALLYDSSRFTSRLDTDELVRRCFKKRGSDGSVVDCVHDVELALAKQGVSCLDARVDHRGLADRLADVLSRDDRVLVGAGCTVAIVPGGTVFKATVDENKFPGEVRDLARRGRVLSDGAIAFLKDHPKFWTDLLNEALDPYRPFIPRDEDARKKLRELGDAAIPRGGNVETNSFVVFNSLPGFRTAAAVAAAIHDERPRRGGSGQPSKYVVVDQNVGVKKGHSVGQFAKQDTFDADALFNVDDSYNVDACRALVVKWQGEIDLFDAAEKDGGEYIIKWGGHANIVPRDFARVTRCKQTVKGERLRGAPLMRHFIAFLEGIIDASSGDDDSI